MDVLSECVRGVRVGFSDCLSDGVSDSRVDYRLDSFSAEVEAKEGEALVSA